MTAVEETGGCFPVSELVTGVTTRQWCRWVSPNTTHTSTPNILWEVRWGTPLQHTPASLSALDIALDGAVIGGVGHM